MLMDWVRLKKYCELTGVTNNAIHQWRRKGVWLDGVQCKIGPDGNVWVNLTEADKWVQNGSMATQQTLTQRTK